MAGDETTTESPGAGEQTPPETPPDLSGYVAKSEVNRIVQERLNSDREQRKVEAEKKALEEQNQYKKLYEDEQKAKSAAEKERDQARSLASQRLISATLSSALSAAGARSDRVEKILKDRELPTPELSGEEIVNKEAFVEAAKAEYAEWFGEAPTAPPPPVPGAGRRDQTSGTAKAGSASSSFIQRQMPASLPS